MRSPAFQFYADDFVAGTLEMSQAEVGSYIRLLCSQWNRGSIPVEPEKLSRLAGGSVSIDVISKFEKCEDGLLRNKRLEEVREKQRQFSESQRVKGIKSAAARSTQVEPRLNHGSVPVDIRLQPKSNSPSPSPSPFSLERESHQPEVTGKPTLKEVLAKAEFIGLAPWKAEDWWNEMEGCGWLDHAHRPIQKWEPILTRVKAKWEADGRPKTPPAAKAKPSNGKPDWTPPRIAV